MVEVLAPAKLNLFLEVLARRADGFHEIETLMTAITIYDTLSFATQTDGRLRLTCEWSLGLGARCARDASAHGGSHWGDLPKETDNIVCRAVERLRDRAGVDHGASMRLIKRIPSAAGLGGASSDAAAALVAANAAWGLGWSPNQLAELGAELGSDIPFFFHLRGTDGAMAVCRGRGEIVQGAVSRGAMHFVVVRPPAGLATADVYRACQPCERPAAIDPLLDSVARGDGVSLGRRLVNRLQPAAEQLTPWISRLRDAFGRLDCLGHQMSGSGTSYFGVFRSARHARRATAFLRAAGLGLVMPARPAHGRQPQITASQP